MSQAGEFFKLGDRGQGLHRKLAPGVNVQIFLGDQTMLSVVRLECNAEGTLHHHPEEQ